VKNQFIISLVKYTSHGVEAAKRLAVMLVPADSGLGVGLGTWSSGLGPEKLVSVTSLSVSQSVTRCVE